MNPERIMKRLVPLVAGVIVLIIAIVAIASGGGGSSTTPVVPISGGTTTAAPLSQAVFIKRADRICKEANASLASLSGTDAQSVAAQLQAVRGELEQLQALGKPASGQADLKSFLAALGDQAAALAAEHRALGSGDGAALSQAQSELTTANTSAQTAAQAFGFNECGGTGVAAATSAATPPATTATTTTPTVTPTATTPTGGTATPGATGGGTGSATGTGTASGGDGAASGGVSPGG